ncbi:hypothetical protein [Pseudodesulfovibrio tunisiensis]|uniref:hypothetical protein n=1 Tax=Pseudodesulfovibrio tunisiensis TaxID=463192 RepID=UPI001FB2FA8F|nr:hypothetical protein [Pseudodesulfovibrio tunisiensis]
MPANTALELLTAYREKARRNPSADRRTLFKYLLWDRFRNRMILDEDIEEMAAASRNLCELTFRVIAREKPHMAEGRLAQAVRDQLRQFFTLNAPDEV